jgi:hypothetical protein
VETKCEEIRELWLHGHCDAIARCGGSCKQRAIDIENREQGYGAIESRVLIGATGHRHFVRRLAQNTRPEGRRAVIRDQREEKRPADTVKTDASRGTFMLRASVMARANGVNRIALIAATAGGDTPSRRARPRLLRVASYSDKPSLAVCGSD